MGVTYFWLSPPIKGPYTSPSSSSIGIALPSVPPWALLDSFCLMVTSLFLFNYSITPL